MPENTAKRGMGRHIMIVISTCLLYVIIYFTSTAISLYYNYIVADLGFALPALKAYYTVAMFAGILPAPFILKTLYPKWGGRKMIAVFGTVGGLAYLALGFSTQLWHFYVLGALTGIGLSSCVTTIANIAINMWFLDKQGMLIGLASSMTGIVGMFFSSPLAKIIEGSWRNGYRISGIIILAIIWVCVLFLFRDSPKSCGLQPYGLEKYMERQKAGAGQKATITGLSLKSALKTPAMWYFVIGLMLFGFLLAFTQSSVGFFMEQGFSLAQAAGFLAWLSGSMIVWKLLLGWLADKIGGKWSFVVACAVAFLGFALQIFLGASVAAVPYIFIICYGCGISSISVLNPVATREVFGMFEYSSVLPIVGMAAGISNSICVILWEVIYGFTNSYKTCAWIAALSAVVLAVFVLMAYGNSKSTKFQALVEEKEM